jgi:hypothetical protein
MDQTIAALPRLSTSISAAAPGGLIFARNFR